MRFDVFLSIVACKTAYSIGKIFNKGSSLPGKIALRICPDVLSRIELPKHIIAVTGSNGKTSTVEMIAHVLSDNGLSVGYNKEGSNQIEGVTTMILRNADLTGKVKCDALVIESDERFARHTFKIIQPTFFVITNLYRDQLTRNGHPEWIYDIVSDAISPKTKLILNADDPLVSKFGYHRDNVVYFSMLRNRFSTDHPVGIYNDGVFCPVCKGKMEYDYYHFNHIGKFHCTNCDFQAQDSKYSVDQMDLEKGSFRINGEYDIQLSFKSTYNVYNLLAAFAAASETGIRAEKIAESLNNYLLTSGRVIRFHTMNHKGVLLISKHENSISYNQSIRYAIAQEGINSVAIIVDAISRKYHTSETSWLWDIDFEFLKSKNIGKIFLMGKYVYDLATRFEMLGLPEGMVTMSLSVEEGVKQIDETGIGNIYVITCFSDKAKFLECVRLDDKYVAK